MVFAHLPHTLLRIVACVVALTAAPAMAATGRGPKPASRVEHVRALDERMAGLVKAGMEQSPTLKGLVDALERSDLIVYVECHNRFRAGEAGSFRFAGVAGDYRYVRVALSSRLNERDLIAFLAHELQHAVELAAAAQVVDQRGVQELYCRIGERVPSGFDTAAARAVTRRVGEELALNPDR